MDNKIAIIDRKVWNFIEDASEQACAEWNRTDRSVRLQATDYVRAVIMQFAA